MLLQGVKGGKRMEDDVTCARHRKHSTTDVAIGFLLVFSDAVKPPHSRLYFCKRFAGGGADLPPSL